MYQSKFEPPFGRFFVDIFKVLGVQGKLSYMSYMYTCCCVLTELWSEISLSTSLQKFEQTNYQKRNGRVGIEVVLQV